jgi:hypothetical protein
VGLSLQFSRENNKAYAKSNIELRFLKLNSSAVAQTLNAVIQQAQKWYTDCTVKAEKP